MKSYSNLKRIGAGLVMTGLAFVSLSSCIDEIIDEGRTNENTIYLKLSTGASSTRADGTSQSSLNEDKIDRVDIYLFPAGSNTNCVHKTFETTDTYGSTTASFQLVEDEINHLFPSDASTCDMYLYVNLPSQTATSLASESPAQYGEATVNSLTDFRKNGAPDNFIMQAKGGKLTLGYNKSTRQFTSSQTEIPVTRIASKIRLAVNPSEFIYTDENGNSLTADEAKAMEANKVHTYALASDRNIRVFLYNGVSLGRLDGTIPSDLSSNESNYFDIPVVAKGENGYDLSRTVQKTEDMEGSDNPDAPVKFPYYNEIPFYSYPNKWENTSSETYRTYMILQIVWNEYNMYVDEDTPTTSSGPKVTYYSVPVTSGSTLEANHYYTVNLNVSMVGGSSSQEVVELEGNYSIEDWVNSDDINVSIKDARFLIVDSYFDMGTDESIEIPFLTSHSVKFNPLEIGKYTIKVSYSDFTEQTTKVTTTKNSSGGVISASLSVNESFEDVTYTDSQNQNSLDINGSSKWLYTYSLNMGDGILTFSHPFRGLDPVGSTSASTASYFKENGKTDTRAYNIEIQISHADMMGTSEEEKWTRKINITQSSSPAQITAEHRKNGALSYSNYYFYDQVLINNITTPASETDINGFLPLFGNYGIYRDDIANNDICRDMYVITLNSAVEKQASVSITRGNVDLSELTAAEKKRRDYLLNLNETMTITFGDGSTETYKIGDPRSTVYNTRLGDANDGGAMTTITPTSQTWDQIKVNNNYSYPTPKGGPRTDPYEGSPFATNGFPTYYYPTREDGTATNVVAPKFYVASQFGDIVRVNLTGTNAYNTMQGIERNVARRRCASYQELGYPGGRWRLPTKAEFEIICNLIAQKQIIDVFSTDDNYWTADGIYKRGANGKAELVNEETNMNDKAFVRCVYDGWYWMDKVSHYHTFDETSNYFFWGDRIMSE